jgi:hypothetical protein
VVEIITKNQEDLFAIGEDGKVFVKSVLAREAWGGWKRIQDGHFPDGFPARPQTIASVKRDEHQEDIFVIGEDGGVYTNWVADHDEWNEWIRIDNPNSPGSFQAREGTSVAAIKRDDDQEDIFVIGEDGGVYTNWVSGHDQWNEWIRIDEDVRDLVEL